MEDFDVFTNEIDYTKPAYKNMLNKFVKDIPHTPSGLNYENGRKLLAEECLADGQEKECAFYLSESICPTLRTMTVYRDEQLKYAGNNLSKIANYIKPIKELVDTNPMSKDEQKLYEFLLDDTNELTDLLDKHEINDELPFYKQYMKFSSDNNVENYTKIVEELPKEWTIIQLTAPYNPNETLKPFNEHRTEIHSIYLTLLTNDYLDENSGPITIEIPANVTKGEVKPLFVELYSILEDNFKTLDNAQFLNNKRLVHNYWSKREDIDLRMKSVINVMYKEWLGGWSTLLSGKLIDKELKEKFIKFIDSAIEDWGFIRLTKKQKILFYNLLENSAILSSQQIKSCIRRILTEHGNIDDVRATINNECNNCTKDFKFINELCLKCLSKSFELIHNFTLVDGIKAFSQVATLIKNGDDWTELKKAKRNPVILIVDELLDPFPFETLPILHEHAVTRIENIHYLYTLYKVHEDRIKDGYYSAKAEIGRYVINPDKNLDRMEARMSAFVKHWCHTWSGHIGEAPPPDVFLQYLTESDIFLYCGHGDGCHFAGGTTGGYGIEGVRVHCVSILAGCASSRVSKAGSGGTSGAPHRQLRVAGCPLTIGMLWEVTDLEVDRVVSELVTLVTPSDVTGPFKKGPEWGKSVVASSNSSSAVSVKNESDVLKAVSKARFASNFLMISSSLVARGIPVRICDDK